MSDILVRLMRYGLVGIVLNVSGYLLYLMVTTLGFGPKTTMTIFYALGVTLGYFGHRRFAFGYSGSHRASIGYGIAHLCGYALNFALLHVFVDRIGFPHQIVQAAAIVLVAGFLFLSFNTFVFPQGDRQASAVQARE